MKQRTESTRRDANENKYRMISLKFNDPSFLNYFQLEFSKTVLVVHNCSGLLKCLLW